MKFFIKTILLGVALMASANLFAGGSRYVAPYEIIPYPKGAGTVYVKSPKATSLGGSTLEPMFKAYGSKKGWSHKASDFKGDFLVYAEENITNWFFVGWTRNEWTEGTDFISTEKGSYDEPVNLMPEQVTSYSFTMQASGSWSDNVHGKECIDWMNEHKESCTFCYGNFARVKVSTASSESQVSCSPIVNKDGDEVTLTAVSSGDETFSYWQRLSDNSQVRYNPFTFTVADGNYGEYVAVFVNSSYPDDGEYICKNAGTNKYLSCSNDILNPTVNREKDYCSSFNAQFGENGEIVSVTTRDEDVYSYRTALTAFAKEVLQSLGVTTDPTDFVERSTRLVLEPDAGGYRIFHYVPELTCGKDWSEIKSKAIELLESTNSLNANQKSFVSKCFNNGIEPDGYYYLVSSSDGSSIHYDNSPSDNYSLWNFYKAEETIFANNSGWARIRNVGTGNYATFVGNEFEIQNPPDFTGIAKMESLDAALNDPGSIFYIRNSSTQSDIYSQDIGLRKKTGEWLFISQSEDDNAACIFVAENNIKRYLNDNGNDVMTGVSSNTSSSTHWSFEPITAESMDKYYFGAKCGAKFTDGEGKYYTTMYTYFPYQCMDGVKAFYAKEVNLTNGVGEVVCKEITSGKVPARTAVILQCNGLTPYENRLVPMPSSYNYNADTPDEAIKPTDPEGRKVFTDNLLIGTYFNLANDYIIRTAYDPEKYLAFSISEDGHLGFYQWTGSYLTPAKAYLDLTKVGSSANSLRLSFVEGEDGIEKVKPAVRMIPIGVYDLQGRKVSNSLDDNLSLPKGIYIVNGKKVVIR